MDIIASIIWVSIFLSQLPRMSEGHGRLLNPPARNTMWRFGFPCPVNYNDNELFCGGFTEHQIVNRGQCGLCGDNWKDPRPRSHETGGKFGIARSTRTYYSGQDITATVELTSNHLGYFIFRICRIYYTDRECSGQDFMNRNVLLVVYPNGTLSRKYVIDTTAKRFIKEITIRLPPGFNCTRCAFQWTYVTGNSWGTCEDGSEAVGCGPQETFINCADVEIVQMPISYSPMTNYIHKGNQPMDPRLTSTSRANPYRKYYRDMSKTGAPMTALANTFQRCCSVDNSTNTPGIDYTCQTRCMKYPPDCPPKLCRCVKDVEALEPFRSEQPMADQWCLDRCNVYPAPNCDETKCHVIYTSAHV